MRLPRSDASPSVCRMFGWRSCLRARERERARSRQRRRTTFGAAAARSVAKAVAGAGHAVRRGAVQHQLALLDQRGAGRRRHPRAVEHLDRALDAGVLRDEDGAARTDAHRHVEHHRAPRYHARRGVANKARGRAGRTQAVEGSRARTRGLERAHEIERHVSRRNASGTDSHGLHAGSRFD